MHPWIVATAGYTLLLSSFINILILIRRALKHCVTSSFYSLSVSDILTSIIIGVLLLLNHSEMISMSYVTNNKNASATADNTWNLEPTDEGQYRIASSEYYEKLNDSNDTNEFNEGPSCDIASVLMHYAMLLVPFTNAFVSLLMFSIQCNVNAKSMNARCTELVNCKVSDRNQKESGENKKDTGTCSTDIEYLKPSTSRQIIQVTREDTELAEKLSLSEKVPSVLDAFKNVKFSDSKEGNSKTTGLYIVIQWLVPAIVTGILYFAEYRKINVISKAENMGCIFEVNFPFNNCYTFTEDNSSVEFSSTNEQNIPAKDDYTASESLLKILDPNNTKVNQVVSEVQKIVQSALHNVQNTSNNVELPTLYNISQPVYEMNYMEIINVTNTVKGSNYVESTESYPVKQPPTKTHSIAFNLPNIHIQNSFHKADTENGSTDKGTELALFEDLMKKASQEMNSNLFETESLYNKTATNISQGSGDMDHEIQTDTTVAILSTEQSMTEKVTETTHKTLTSMSDDQIYADIIKRIQSVSIQTGSGDKNKVIYHYSKKKPKQSNIGFQHLPSHLPFITKLFSESGNILTANSKEEIMCMKRMDDKCFVSAKFVKLHLLVLIFTIYFLPILFSAILQERGKLVCQNILDKLESKVTTTTPTSQRSETKEVDNGTSCRNKTDNTEIFWYSEDGDVTHDAEQKDTSKITEIQTIEATGTQESNSELLEKKQKYMCALQETKDIQGHFHSIKRSLLFGTILWTPMFLELLLKVFLCMPISKWLTSTTFLSALSFNILRNVFNLKLTKVRNSDVSGNRKENTVHPTA